MYNLPNKKQKIVNIRIYLQLKIENKKINNKKLIQIQKKNLNINKNKNQTKKE